MHFQAGHWEQERPWETDPDPAPREVGPGWTNNQESCKEIQTL